MVKVKICGLTDIEDILFAVENGVDYLGLVFVKNHRHHLRPQQAGEISRLIKGKVKLVGIFVNESLKIIKKLTKDYRLDYVQLHGQETPDFCKRVRRFVPVMKAFGFNNGVTIDDARKMMQPFKVDYYIVDRQKQGEGKIVDFRLSVLIAKEFPIFLAGGLTAANVADAVKLVSPFGVDVSSGIETNGKTDREKIIQFIKKAKKRL
jgi:phosphoribosylanthranilate isomerase